MNEDAAEEFTEKFASVEEALKYIADSQAKSEFVRKRETVEFDRKIAEVRELQTHTQQQIDKTQRQLDHITSVLRFNIEAYEFQSEKIEAAGKILSRRREK